MYDLSERIKDLAVKYLIAECRDFNGKVDRTKQADAVVKMLTASHISKTFDFTDEGYWRDKEYKSQLERLLANRNSDSIDSSNNERASIFKEIINELIEKTEDEVQANKVARDAWKLREQIEDLKAQIEFGKPASSVTAWDRLNSRVNLPYFVIICLVIVLIGGLVVMGMTATMTVNVEFSIGEIIGALLVGTGVAAAGVSYATRKTEERRGENE